MDLTSQVVAPKPYRLNSPRSVGSDGHDSGVDNPVPKLSASSPAFFGEREQASHEILSILSQSGTLQEDLTRSFQAEYEFSFFQDEAEEDAVEGDSCSDTEDSDSDYLSDCDKHQFDPLGSPTRQPFSPPIRTRNPVVSDSRFRKPIKQRRLFHL
jgi:hypothetical protein